MDSRHSHGPGSDGLLAHLWQLRRPANLQLLPLRGRPRLRRRT